jgi:hypothetical protein
LMLQSFNKDDTKRVYKLIGKCDAFSLNWHNVIKHDKM